MISPNTADQTEAVPPLSQGETWGMDTQEMHRVGRHTWASVGLFERLAQYLGLYIVHGLVLTQWKILSCCSLDGS